MTRIRNPGIYTQNLHVFLCTDSADGISLSYDTFRTSGWFTARGSWEDRPENYRGGRLVHAIVPGVRGVIGRSRGHGWSADYPLHIPPILDDLDRILRSRRADDFLTRFYRKYGREGFPPLAPYSH